MGRPTRAWLALSTIRDALARRRSGFADPAELVLALADLPPGWTSAGRREWPSGHGDEPWALRIRAAGGRSASAAFRSATSGSTTATSAATPLVDAADAAAAYAVSLERIPPSSDPRTLAPARDELALAGAPGDEHRALRLASDIEGRAGEQLVIVWRRGSVVATLSVSGEPGTFAADDLVRLAHAQDARIRRVLDA